MQQIVVHLLMSFSPTLNIPSFIFRVFFIQRLHYFSCKKVTSETPGSACPTYKITLHLPPRWKAPSLLQVKDVLAPLIPHFWNLKVLHLLEGCLHYQKGTLNFVHIFNDLVFLQYWNISYTICFKYYTLYFFTQISDSSAKIYSSTLLAYSIYEYIVDKK